MTRHSRQQKIKLIMYTYQPGSTRQQGYASTSEIPFPDWYSSSTLDLRLGTALRPLAPSSLASCWADPYLTYRPPASPTRRDGKFCSRQSLIPHPHFLQQAEFGIASFYMCVASYCFNELDWRGRRQDSRCIGVDVS
jgi:hypothetical protein